MSRTRSDYMLEASHLVDEIESVAPEVATKYTNLIDDMEHKVDLLWCYMLDLRSAIEYMEKEMGQEVYSDKLYLTFKKTLDVLTQRTHWQFFNE